MNRVGITVSTVIGVVWAAAFSVDASAQSQEPREFKGIQVGGNATLSIAPGYGLPLYVRAGGLNNGKHEVRVRGCACSESCEVLRTQKILVRNRRFGPEIVWREVEPLHAFKARLVDGKCIDSQTGYRIPDWVTEICVTDCSTREEGKDAERFDFSVSIHRVSGKNKTEKRPIYCAGTYGWRNGTAGHWVVAARRDKSARTGEADWPDGFLRINSVIVAKKAARSHALHVVAGGLEPNVSYWVAIKPDSTPGYNVGDPVKKKELARLHQLTRKPVKLKGPRAVRTAKILNPSRLKSIVGQTFDLLLLKKTGKNMFEIKAIDNPETPGFSIQRPVPATRPDKDLVQKPLTYKTTFGLGETISVGVNPPYAVQCKGQSANIHIVESGCTLGDQDRIALAGCTLKVMVTVPIQPGCRNVNTHKITNSKRLGVGSYCTVVDIDRDGRYDRGLDVADGCVHDDPTPGFTVKKAPPAPVVPSVCEQFLLIRQKVGKQIKALRKRAKRHLKLKEEWDYCKHFAWRVEMNHPPKNQPKPGDPQIQSVKVGKRMLRIIKLILSAVEFVDIRVDLLIVGKADAIRIGPRTVYDGPETIELENETITAQPGEKLTNKVLAALRAWRLKQSIESHHVFQQLHGKGRTKTTLIIDYQPTDGTGKKGAHYRGGVIRIKVILNIGKPGGIGHT